MEYSTWNHENCTIYADRDTMNKSTPREFHRIGNTGGSLRWDPNILSPDQSRKKLLQLPKLPISDIPVSAAIILPISYLEAAMVA